MRGIAGIWAPGRPAAALRPLGAVLAAGLGGDANAVRAADGIVWVSESEPENARAGARFALALSGEIYNREELLAAAGSVPGPADAGESLTAAAAAVGPSAAFRRARGHFAGALWDKTERRLALFRDHLGAEPLYYGRVVLPGVDGVLAFASDLRALRGLPGFSPRVDRRALAQLVERSFCRDCIWEGFFRLPPGCFLMVSAFSRPGVESPPPEAFWSLPETAARAQGCAFSGTEEDVEDELAALLSASVRERTPAAVLLSGGIDAALLAALSVRVNNRPLPAFTLGFSDARYDETAPAAAIARHLGLEHHCVQLRADDVSALVAELPRLWGEPFADSSQIPTLLACRAAGARAVMTGDGGDENFGGYERYLAAAGFGACWERLPSAVRRALNCVLPLFPEAAAEFLGRCRPGAYPRNWGGKFSRLRRALGAGDFAGFYAALTASGRAGLVPGAEDGAAAEMREFWARLPEPPRPGADYAARAMLYDLACLVPDDFLVKTGTAARALGLDLRAPYLDPRVVEWALRLPPGWKIRPGGLWTKGEKKRILRRLWKRWLPETLLPPQKKGFSVPLSAWLRGGLREWADALLDYSRLNRGGWFDAAAVSRLWAEHCAGRRDHALCLWNILMFLAWENAGR